MGLHMMAEENARRSDRDSSLDQEKCRSMAAQKSPVWSGDVFDGERSEDTSSVEHYEHNVDNFAKQVVGQRWSSEVISFFLEDWEVGRVALSCHMSVDLVCPEMRDACWESSVSLESLRSLFSESQERRRRCSDA